MDFDNSDPIESCEPTPVVVASSLLEADPIEDPDQTQVGISQKYESRDKRRRGLDKKRAADKRAGDDRERGRAVSSKSRKENDPQKPMEAPSHGGGAVPKGGHRQHYQASKTPLSRSPSRPSSSPSSPSNATQAARTTPSQSSSGLRQQYQPIRRDQDMKSSFHSSKPYGSRSRKLGALSSSEEKEDGRNGPEEDEGEGSAQKQEFRRRTMHSKAFAHLPTASAPLGRGQNGAKILVADTPLPTPAARKGPKILVPETPESTARHRSTQPRTQAQERRRGEVDCTEAGVGATHPSSLYPFGQPGKMPERAEDSELFDGRHDGLRSDRIAGRGGSVATEDGKTGSKEDDSPSSTKKRKIDSQSDQEEEGARKSTGQRTSDEEEEEEEEDPFTYSKPEQEDERDEDEEMEFPDSAQRESSQQFAPQFENDDSSEDGYGGDADPYESSGGGGHFDLGDFGGGEDDDDDEQLPYLPASSHGYSPAKPSRRANSSTPFASGRPGHRSPSQSTSHLQAKSGHRSGEASPAISQDSVQTTQETTDRERLRTLSKRLPQALHTNKTNALLRRAHGKGSKLTNVRINGEDTRPEERRKGRTVSIADGAVAKMDEKWGVTEGDGVVRGGRTLRARKGKE